MLPPVIDEIADEERGLILLTGTTGSGKSTTLAAMIDHINTNYAKHIVTIEDPVEFLHRDKTSIINQREVGEDTASFARALRRVLRQDPDVILVGEMRDEETVRTALSAAETGHLVLSTIHTVDAAESVNRIIDFFPQAEQRQARAMLAGTLKAVISQRLVPTPDKNGRVATCEILRMTGRVRDMIMNPEETGKLPEVISEGAYYGMQTFDQALLYHVQQGRVAMEDALKAATHPHDFKLLVSSDGLRSTSVESVLPATRSEEPEAAAPTNGAEPSVTGAPGRVTRSLSLDAALVAHVARAADEPRRARRSKRAWMPGARRSAGCAARAGGPCAALTGRRRRSSSPSSSAISSSISSSSEKPLAAAAEGEAVPPGRSERGTRTGTVMRWRRRGGAGR